MIPKPKRCTYCGTESRPMVSSTCCRACYDYNRKAERQNFNKIKKQEFSEILTLEEAKEAQRMDREKNGLSNS